MNAFRWLNPLSSWRAWWGVLIGLVVLDSILRLTGWMPLLVALLVWPVCTAWERHWRNP